MKFIIKTNITKCSTHTDKKLHTKMFRLQESKKTGSSPSLLQSIYIYGGNISLDCLVQLHHKIKQNKSQSLDVFQIYDYILQYIRLYLSPLKGQCHEMFEVQIGQIREKSRYNNRVTLFLQFYILSHLAGANRREKTYSAPTSIWIS